MAIWVVVIAGLLLCVVAPVTVGIVSLLDLGPLASAVIALIVAGAVALVVLWMPWEGERAQFREIEAEMHQSRVQGLSPR
jgi:hypothetical protein